jgi:hypothetical protein
MADRGIKFNDLFAAESVAHIWDFFNAMPFELKTRVLLSGIMHLALDNLGLKTAEKLMKCLVSDEFLAKYGGDL